MIDIGSPVFTAWLRIAKWCVLLAVVALCYMPGLGGSFVFDDEVNILHNPNLWPRTLAWDQLSSAAWSGGAGPLGRPLAMLTFALNLYGTGSDPYFFKLTNLLIHLLNVVLVGILSQGILEQFDRNKNPAKHTPAWLGWAVAAAWGLHPLNLTSVLYVVQRMTSLSATFGLLALVVYVVGVRANNVESRAIPSRWNLLFRIFVVLASLAASALTKESGLLFLPLLLWIEYLVFRFHAGGSALRIGRWPLSRIVNGMLLIAAAILVLFVLPKMLAPGAFVNRDFTLAERAMTESRVIFYYLRLFLLPRSSELSLYHDDFRISIGLFEPTTIFAVGGLLIITWATIALRKEAPIVLFGWGWFLISHALESTVFPLELVHEHRNYFATIGLLGAFAWGLSQVQVPFRRVTYVLAACYVVLLSGVTFTRSLQWSNNVDLALLEASNHPDSPRANYELARNYLALLETTGERRFGPLAEQALDRAVGGYLPGLGPLFGLIHLNYYSGETPDPALIAELNRRLRNGPFYNGNTSFLKSFLLCQMDQRCKMPDEQVTQLFQSALENPRIPLDKKAEVYKFLAQYEINRRGDVARGAELIAIAAQTFDSAGTRVMYAQALGMQGQFSEGLKQLDLAEDLDRLNVYRVRIANERAALRKAEAP